MPDNRTYHALVPVTIVAADTIPSLALSSDLAQSEDLPMDHLRLRPIAGVRQPFFVFVKSSPCTGFGPGTEKCVGTIAPRLRRESPLSTPSYSSERAATRSQDGHADYTSLHVNDGAPLRGGA